MSIISYSYGYSQGKSFLKQNSNTFEKWEYGHLGSWYNKSTLSIYEALKLKQNFQKG